MQRQLEAVTVSTATCVGCHQTLSDDRCTHCGAAAKAGPYRILQLISRSQHGAMYLAEDEAGAKVALKELVFSLVPTTQELDAFTREAALLQTLDHPRIPKFLESFTVGQGVSTRLYLAQQYLSGQSLMQRLETEHFDEDSVLVLARQALLVLAYLHGRSPVVVHRDVKPDNFILKPDGTLCLVDFGAARSVKAAGTHRATLVGTFGYMAPEQLGGTVDARSDLYGLGATLIHLLTRTPPERLLGPGMSLDFQKHVNVTVKTERFLSRLVAARPDQRFASAEEALAVLEGRASSSPRSGSRSVLMLGSVSVALFTGALAFWLASRPVSQEQGPTPMVVPEVAEAPRPAPAVEKVELPTLAPAAGRVRFTHVRADWQFRKPGHYVIDDSGRGHHALLPTTGFTNDFFGLVWDGTTGLSVADSMDFAPTGPFTISTSFKLAEGPLTAPVTLISRGDPNGKFAWAAQVVPEDGMEMLRFSVANEAGQVASVQTRLLRGANESSVYFSYDPKLGELRIVRGCVPVVVPTAIRPARTLPPETRLQLITGLRGSVQRLELMTGLMQPSAPRDCSFSGERLDEE